MFPILWWQKIWVRTFSGWSLLLIFSSVFTFLELPLSKNKQTNQPKCSSCCRTLHWKQTNSDMGLSTASIYLFYKGHLITSLPSRNSKSQEKENHHIQNISWKLPVLGQMKYSLSLLMASLVSSCLPAPAWVFVSRSLASCRDCWRLKGKPPHHLWGRRTETPVTEASVALCFLPSTWESSCSQSMDHILTLTQRTYVSDHYSWEKKKKRYIYLYLKKKKKKAHSKKKSSPQAYAFLVPCKKWNYYCRRYSDCIM